MNKAIEKILRNKLSRAILRCEIFSRFGKLFAFYSFIPRGREGLTSSSAEKFLPTEVQQRESCKHKGNCEVFRLLSTR